MPNYQNAKIYKLWSPEGDDIYIGSTTTLLSARKAKHKFGCGAVSKILFEKYTDIRIELLECCPCDNKEELLKKEGEYIRNNNCVNKQVPLRTGKEYYQDNKDYKIQYQKEYRENNLEKIKERKSIKVMCECGLEVNKDAIARHRKSQGHLDKINGNIKNYAKEIIKCDCGGSYQLYRKKRHERTQKHQDMVNTFGNLK